MAAQGTKNRQAKATQAKASSQNQQSSQELQLQEEVTSNASSTVGRSRRKESPEEKSSNLAGIALPNTWLLKMQVSAWMFSIMQEK